MGLLEGLDWRRTRSNSGRKARLWALAAPLRRNLYAQRDLLFEQVGTVQGLMALLMKPTNTRQPWTREELRQLRAHLRASIRLVPVLAVFLLPGGLLLLPLLAEVLDRRRIPRE